MLHLPLSLYLPIEKHASSLRTLWDFGNLWKITKILGPIWPTWHNGNLPYRTKFQRTKLSNFGDQCRKFCPSKFCPIRYYLTLLSVRFFRYKSEHICMSNPSVVRTLFHTLLHSIKGTGLKVSCLVSFVLFGTGFTKGSRCLF